MLESLFNKLEVLLKRDSNTDVFLNIAKFLRESILKNFCERVLLDHDNVPLISMNPAQNAESCSLQTTIISVSENKFEK